MREDVVRERARAGQRQAGDDGEDRRKRDRGDESEERRAAKQLREERRRHVAAGVDPPDRLAADQRRRAEADDRNDQIEVADEPGRVEHRRARGARVGHGVEAHQDVRQPEQAEHQRQAERNRVDRIADEAAGFERGLPVPRRDGRIQLARRKMEIATSTRSVSSVTPNSSRIALMICTHVVAIMPPNST